MARNPSQTARVGENPGAVAKPWQAFAEATGETFAHVRDQRLPRGQSSMTTANGGRPPHASTEQTRALVETFSAFGIPQDDIAKVIGITKPTLHEHYRSELDLGLIKANAKVAQNLFTIACKQTREGLDAAKFWLRVRAGWSEYSPPPVTSRTEEPLGKKAQAEAEAETAHEGTEWGALLRH